MSYTQTSNVFVVVHVVSISNIKVTLYITLKGVPRDWDLLVSNVQICHVYIDTCAILYCCRHVQTVFHGVDSLRYGLARKILCTCIRCLDFQTEPFVVVALWGDGISQAYSLRVSSFTDIRRPRKAPFLTALSASTCQISLRPDGVQPV